MKRIICSIILAASIIAAPIAVQAANERGYITVNTFAEKEIAPDVAEISFAIKTSDTKSMQKAADANKEIADKLYSVLSDMLKPSNGDFIKTSGYNASPVYSYNNGKKTLTRYEASNRVTIHTKNIDKVGLIIDKAIAAGATNVDSLSFSVSDKDAYCTEILEMAAKKAHTRANVIARTLNANLDGVRTFDTNCNSNNYNAPRMLYAKSMLADTAVEEAAGATAISAGVIKVNANVSASFFVK